MAKTIALSDSTRGIIELIAKILIVAQAYLITNAVIGQNLSVPPEMIWILALANAIMVVVKEFLGTRDATTARVAKEVDGSYPQYRAVPAKTAD